MKGAVVMDTPPGLKHMDWLYNKTVFENHIAPLLNDW